MPPPRVEFPWVPPPRVDWARLSCALASPVVTVPLAVDTVFGTGGGRVKSPGRVLPIRSNQNILPCSSFIRIGKLCRPLYFRWEWEYDIDRVHDSLGRNVASRGSTVKHLSSSIMAMCIKPSSVGSSSSHQGSRSSSFSLGKWMWKDVVKKPLLRIRILIFCRGDPNTSGVNSNV